MTNNNQVNAMYVATNGTMDGLSINYSSTGATNTGQGVLTSTVNTLGSVCKSSAWDYWQNYYYPQVIRESYPVYIKERAEDKGKQAFEVIKMLQDKRFVKFEKVSDFIDAMDALIKIL